MPKTELTLAEVRAYSRLARAAREVERLETRRRKRLIERLLAQSDGKLMLASDARLRRKGVSHAD